MKKNEIMKKKIKFYIKRNSIIVGLLTIGINLFNSCSKPEKIDANLYKDIAKIDVEFNDFFLNQTGWKSNSKWYGADAAFSIPLSRVDQPGSATDTTKTLWIFADTSVGLSRGGVKLVVYNSLALMIGSNPGTASLDFIVGPMGNGQLTEWGDASSVFSANTPRALLNSDKHPRLWLNDGVRIGDFLYLFARLIIDVNVDPWYFRDGTVLIKIPVEGNNIDLEKSEQIDHHLFIPDNGTHMNSPFGSAILDNTEEAEAPAPDGYIYVYGVTWFREAWQFRLYVSRVRPEDFEDENAWRYYANGEWQTDILKSTTIAQGVEEENTILPLKDGRYLLIAEQQSGFYYTIADHPWGPFDFEKRVMFYKIPEKTETTVFGKFDTYNGKAHPNLSTNEYLLVSYNVNHFPFYPYLNTHDDYRPRFLRLYWKDIL
jgi:hypothetical protein